jgi:peptidoglycan-N-acetylglucosamine deacetylase
MFMRLAVLSLCALCALFDPAFAGSEAQGCAAADVLGVARTIDIDATGGPWFGTPHGEPDFLAPGEVVLTFDDGPIPRTTRPILAALAAQCAKATFFMVGEMAKEYPDVVREVVEQGHTIGTHTWSHRDLKRLSEDKMKAQIEMALNAVATAAGAPIAPFFRYPYLSYSPASVAYLQGRNVAQFAVDVDSFDWRTHSGQGIVRRVMAGLQRSGRGIILLHDIHDSTAAAVPPLLAQLKAKGYRLVHLRAKAAAETLQSYAPPGRVSVASSSGLHRLHGHGNRRSRRSVDDW